MTTLEAPPPTPVSEPYWSSLAAGEMLLPKCSDCNERFFPPQPACPRCLSEAISWVTPSGRGTVTALTVVHQKPAPDFDVPFALALVRLDEGWTLMSHVVDCEPGEVRIGMPVQLRLRRSGPTGSGAPVPVFSPA